jgi:hypothetical protein
MSDNQQQRQQQERAESLGQRRVRLSFNPGGNDLVNEIKGKAAELIDLCAQHMDKEGPSETLRLWSLAQTHFEDAAMWAVKAATA